MGHQLLRAAGGEYARQPWPQHPDRPGPRELGPGPRQDVCDDLRALAAAPGRSVQYFQPSEFCRAVRTNRIQRRGRSWESDGRADLGADYVDGDHGAAGPARHEIFVLESE